MKKALLTTLCLAFSGLTLADITGSTISLLNKTEITPTKSLTIPLDSLLKATYNVTCLLTNTNLQPVDVSLAVDSKSDLQHTQFTLNDETLTNGQATLQNGENRVNFAIAVNSNGNALIVKNLNFDASVQVSNCVAKPITNKTFVNVASGYFTASNKTDKTVTIGVGNFSQRHIRLHHINLL